MRTNKRIYLLTIAYMQLLAVVFVLPWFSFPGYSILRNTVYDLGGQIAPHAWILNFTIILLAIGSLIAGWERFEGFVLHRILLVSFSAFLLLTAFFNHTPVHAGNMMEGILHEYFCGTTGILFTIMSTATCFVMETQLERILSIATGLSSIVLIVMASEWEQMAGVWQRLLFIISFGWMIYNFISREY